METDFSFVDNSRDLIYWILGISIPIILTFFYLWIYRQVHKPRPQDKLPETLPETFRGTASSELQKSVTPEADKIQAASEVPTLRQALRSTRETLLGRIRNALSGASGSSGEVIEQIEEVLYTSDLGPKTVQRLLKDIGHGASADLNLDQIKQKLSRSMLEIFSAVAKPMQVPVSEDFLNITLVVGVNGAGKTTTIGKLAAHYASLGQKVMVAAGDTFRAAAGAQLTRWSERAQVQIFAPEGVSDPSAIAYSAVEKAKSLKMNQLIIDTAGRLHVQKNLMEELKKIKRSLAKVSPGSPQEVLLVLDANSGQNAFAQAKEFNDALQVTGVVLTKLDGSAKGGVALGLALELGLPIQLIGVGEGINDLRPFNADEFVASLL